MAWGLFGDAAIREVQDIGWRVAQYFGDQKLNAGLLNNLDHAPTLYLALEKLISMISAEASHLQLGLVELPFSVLFFTHYPGMREVPGYQVSQLYQLGVYIDLIRHFAGTRWSPSEIGVEASIAPTRLIEQFPSADIKINQPFGYVAISRSCLHRKLQSSHAESSKDVPIVNIDGLSFAEMLGHLLEPYLSAGYPSMRRAASLVDLSVRTLARRLAACGTNYQAVVDEVRFRQASALLGNADRPISEVAWSVGFDDQANFSRMFRRIGGLSPRQFRQDIFSQHPGRSPGN